MRMGIGLVVYGRPAGLNAGKEQLIRLFPEAEIRVVNNMPNAAIDRQEQGHNRQFEFGAYLSLLGAFQDFDKVLIINDTWITQHATKAWAQLWKRAMNAEGQELGVWADLRFDGAAFDERPNPFASSWFMLARNTESVSVLFETLQTTLIQETLISPSYNDFLNAWLKARLPFFGWHGGSKTTDKNRKRLCIVWEHRWSKELRQRGVELLQLNNQGKFLHLYCRLHDRWVTRQYALLRFLKMR